MAIKIVPNANALKTIGRHKHANSQVADESLMAYQVHGLGTNSPNPEDSTTDPNGNGNGIDYGSNGSSKARDPNMQWTWQQRRFQQWCALPKSVRPENLRTYNQVAKALGVPISTLSAWRHMPGWWDAVYNESLAIIGEDLGDIIKAQVNEAKIGSTRAAIFCMKMLGVFREEPTAVHHEIEPLTVILSPDVQQFKELQESVSAPPTPGHPLPARTKPQLEHPTQTQTAHHSDQVAQVIKQRGRDRTPADERDQMLSQDDHDPDAIIIDMREFEEADAEIRGESAAESLYSL